MNKQAYWFLWLSSAVDWLFNEILHKYLVSKHQCYSKKIIQPIRYLLGRLKLKFKNLLGRQDSQTVTIQRKEEFRIVSQGLTTLAVKRKFNTNFDLKRVLIFVWKNYNIKKVMGETHDIDTTLRVSRERIRNQPIFVYSRASVAFEAFPCVVQTLKFKLILCTVWIQINSRPSTAWGIAVSTERQPLRACFSFVICFAFCIYRPTAIIKWWKIGPILP